MKSTNIVLSQNPNGFGYSVTTTTPCASIPAWREIYIPYIACNFSLPRIKTSPIELTRVLSENIWNQVQADNFLHLVQCEVVKLAKKSVVSVDTDVIKWYNSIHYDAWGIYTIENQNEKKIVWSKSNTRALAVSKMMPSSRVQFVYPTIWIEGNTTATELVSKYKLGIHVSEFSTASDDIIDSNGVYTPFNVLDAPNVGTSNTLNTFEEKSDMQLSDDQEEYDDEKEIILKCAIALQEEIQEFENYKKEFIKVNDIHIHTSDISDASLIILFDLRISNQVYYIPTSEWLHYSSIHDFSSNRIIPKEWSKYQAAPVCSKSSIKQCIIYK